MVDGCGLKGGGLSGGRFRGKGFQTDGHRKGLKPWASTPERLLLARRSSVRQEALKAAGVFPIKSRKEEFHTCRRYKCRHFVGSSEREKISTPKHEVGNQVAPRNAKDVYRASPGCRSFLDSSTKSVSRSLMRSRSMGGLLDRIFGGAPKQS